MTSQREKTNERKEKSSAVTFCSFHAMVLSVIYYNTRAGQNEIYLLHTSKVLKHANEKLLCDRTHKNQ